MQRLNPSWQTKYLDEFSKAKEEDRTPTVDEVLSYPVAVKWLVSCLANRGVPYKVISLGGGVKRVTTKTEICSKCNGTGRC